MEFFKRSVHLTSLEELVMSGIDVLTDDIVKRVFTATTIFKDNL